MGERMGHYLTTVILNRPISGRESALMVQVHDPTSPACKISLGLELKAPVEILDNKTKMKRETGFK